MKLARILFALVLITAAGVAFAAQPAADTAEEPAAAEALVTAPAQDEVLPSGIEGLFVEPEEAGACCFARCGEERTACTDACGADTACRTACWDEYQECTKDC